MATYSWNTGASGNWTTAAAWTPAGVPSAESADVVIDAVPATGVDAYVVTIPSGQNEVVNSITLNGTNNLLSINQPPPAPYRGAQLAVDGTLTFASGSTGEIGGPLQSFVQMTNGTIINAGTINAFVQVAGTALFIGANPIYFTNWLQSLGVTTIDTARIGEYNAAGKTLFDGIFEAKGPGSAINFGGNNGGLVVDMTAVNGPKPVLTQDFWTQLIFDGAGSSINEWNGTAYVPVETTLTSVGVGGIITVTGGRNYTTANPFTIGSDGRFEQTSGILSTGGIVIVSGGTLSNGLLSPHEHTVAASTDSTPLTVAGSVANNGTIDAYGRGIILTGPVTGAGTMTFNPSGASTLELANSVSAGEVVALNGSDKLVLDQALSFTGTIAASGAGNSIVLRNLDGATAAITGNTLQIKSGATVIGSIALTGDVAGTTVTVATTGLSILDTTTKQAVPQASQTYAGPVAGVENQYINVTTDSLNIAATTPSWFLYSGSGNDALVATSGTNVLNGGTGTNYLTGGAGADTFLIGAGSPTAATWSTLINFRAGDNATFFGLNPKDFSYDYQDNQGTPGYTGLTLHATAAGKAETTMTIANYAKADMTNGRLTVTTASDGSYINFHANS